MTLYNSTPPSPRYYLHMSEATKQRLAREVDEFGDSYFDDVSSTSELAQVR